MRRLLLIEDHEQNGLSFLRMLKAHGFDEVVWEREGIAGLERALLSHYDAILVDLDLPCLDGMHVALTLYRHIQYEAIPPVPMIALTARTDTATRAEAARVGFRAWVSKPCSEGLLSATLAAVLGGA